MQVDSKTTLLLKAVMHLPVEVYLKKQYSSTAVNVISTNLRPLKHFYLFL